MEITRTRNDSKVITSLACMLVFGFVESAAADRHKSSGGPHCGHHNPKYEFQTIVWNPPFAKERGEAKMQQLQDAGAQGFKLVEVLPDGSGAQVLMMQKRVSQCDMHK